jgi:putative salt-induced outer membrane protein YdiY
MALCATAPAIAAAQDKPAAPPARADSTHLTADLRFVSAAGNASSTTLSTGDKLTHWAGPWTFVQELQVIYGKNDSITVANFYHGALRAKYGASPKFGAFGYIVWERDTPGGIVRRFEEGLGVAYQALDRPHDKLSIEAGPTMVQERHAPMTDNNFAAARIAAAYHHLFEKKATFEQLFEYLPDLQDMTNYRMNAKSTLSVPLSSAFALSVSYDLRYSHVPPVGRKTTDSFLTAGLQLTL